MQNANSTNGDLLPHEVDINLNVLCATMLNWVG
jgi:hypothetical protein